MKRLVVALLVAIVLTSFLALPVPDKAGHPNVILFFMDDMGYGDLSCYGALGYQTPHLDKMAAEGTRFTNFLVAQAVCTASRAALLTGCYPNRIGLYGALGPNSPIGLNSSEETLAELLKEQGYATGIFGKWHLGSQPQFLPRQHGFDEYYGVPYSHDMWPLHPAQASANYPPLQLIEGDKPVKAVNTLEDVSELTSSLTHRTVQFIRKHKKEPFFLYVPHPLPHVPLAASTRFRGKTARGLFGDVIEELDWSVGQILDEVKKQGLDKNTLVIFTSDNGPWLNYGDHAGSTGGFREGKGTTFDGGHRVPCIIRWPGKVPVGRVSNKLLSTLDILPTVASLCGARQPTQKIDGVSFEALLKGDESAAPREQFYYYYRRNSLEAVRKGDWKLVLPHEGRSYEGQLPGTNGMPGKAPENHPFPLALYNLGRDPGERYDVKDVFPAMVTELQRLAEEAREDLGDDITQRPGKNVRASGIASK
ncbi:sulfatase [Nibrella viscosa]|uniref:Sulfatase n=1 Tax=Nibrella viscosa TaxID=1084524 RepID=A0ABP8K219_9BACT